LAQVPFWHCGPCLDRNAGNAAVLMAVATCRAQLTLLALAFLAKAEGSTLLHRGRRSAAKDAAACTCDCCVVQKDAPQFGSTGHDGVTCSPRTSTASAALGDDGGCSSTCQVPEDGMQAFDSRTGEIDISRYCMASCQPGSLSLNMLCVSRSSGDAAMPRGDGQFGGPWRAQPIAAHAVHAKTAKAQNAMGNNGAMLALAKGQMERARSQAQAAGEAARLAKGSYDRILASTKAMSEAAAQATAVELWKAAGAQSAEAAEIRRKFENQVRSKATMQAIKAALVYKKALARDMLIAKQWAARAEQFVTAATERDDKAAVATSRAENYKIRKDWTRERQWTVKAHQFLDEAKGYKEKEKGAREQAKAIRDSRAWYEYAEKAAALNTLYLNLPPGVYPPPLPILP